MRTFGLFLVLLGGCSPSTLQPYGAEPAEELADDAIAGEIVINERLPEGLAQDLGLTLLDYDDVLGAGLYLADEDASLATLETTLKRHLGEVRVEANRIRTISAADPYRELQWNLDLLDVETAWSWSKGAGVTVAVIDTGVTSAGEDTPVNLIAGYDFVANDWDPTDENGHGTHVAGTIAQATSNGRGVAGVAPEVNLLAVRALDKYGTGSAYWTAKAIIWAADNGADVINLSLGSSSSTGVELDAIRYADSKDVLLVCASGNSGRNRLDYPAAYAETIAVGAVGFGGAVAGYSNGGTGLDLVAPGGDLGRDGNRDGYADGILQETLVGRRLSYEFFEGTSMAAPHVAGVAALLLGAGAKPDEVRDLLTATATDLEGAGWSTRSGWGLVDPVAALSAISAPDPVAEPDPEPEPEPEPGDTSAPVITAVDGWRLGQSMYLFWSTNEPATTEVIFEDYGAFSDGDLVTQHEMGFTINPYETYYFTVVSVDAAGNRSEDGVWVMYP